MRDRDPMRSLVAAFPEMLEEAWAADPPAGYPLDDGRAILLCGMGGSGMAGALAAEILREGRRLALGWRNPGLPEWADSRDRAVVVSYSGATWEAQAMIEEARARSIPTRVVASGGAIARRAEEAGIPLFQVPIGMPPRASLPWLLVGVLRATGGVEAAEIARAVALLREERATPLPGRDPAEIAGSIAGRLAVFLPVGPMREVVAIRWRNQLLENAEQAAIVSPLPEMAHNEVMGWPWLREREIPISLHPLVDPGRPAEVWSPLIRALEREAGRSGHPFRPIPPHPAGGIASALADLFLADRVSVELAERRGVEPTPVEAIRRLRAATGAQRPDPSK